MKHFYKLLVLSLFMFVNIFTLSAQAADSTFISVPTTKNPQQEKSINLIKTYYDSYNKRDSATFLSTISPDVTYDNNQGKSEKGLKSFKTVTEEVFNSFNEKLDHIVILVSDDGKHAAASWVNHGTYVKDYPLINVKANNQKYVVPGAEFFQINDGKITRVTLYYNAADFMRQIKK